MPDMNENAETQQEYFGIQEDVLSLRIANRALKETSKEIQEELTEAKEIIKDLLIVYKQYNQTDTYIRAERFLQGGGQKMTDKKTFKGFSLDSRGDVIGAFPSVDVIQERRKDLINEVAKNINQMTIDYCLKFNIDPDVLIKQKAEIELLQMKIEKMKCCENCKHPYWNAETEAEETVCDNCINNNNWELKS